MIGCGGFQNFDPRTGIHYGVISYNSVSSEAVSDVIMNGKDLALEEALEALHRTAEEEDWDNNRIQEEEESLYENWEGGIGNTNYWYEDREYTIWTTDLGLYIIESPYYTMAPYCSPCCPNAGNLDDIDPKRPMKDYPAMTYCLDKSWFDEYHPINYKYKKVPKKFQRDKLQKRLED